MSFKLFGRKKQDDGGVDQESQLRNNPKDVDAADEEEDVEQEYNGSANEDDDIKLANPKGPSLFSQPRRASFFERLVRAKSPESKSSLSSEASSSLPPLPPVNLLGYKPSTKHRLLDQELAENIRLLATPRNQLYEDWELVYSLEQHGISLKTLYRNCDPEYQLEKLRNTTKQTGYADSVVRAATSHHHHGHGGDVRRHHSYVIVIKDEKNNKFGCYLNEHLRAVEEQRWYGNGECFLWKCEKYDPQLLNHSISQGEETEPTQDDANEQTRVPQVSTRFKAFVHTNLNSNIIYSNNECISIGSSNGRNGLWIDKSMYHGVSYPCDTFGNEILNGSGNSKFGKFKIMGLEVWRIGALVDRS